MKKRIIALLLSVMTVFSLFTVANAQKKTSADLDGDNVSSCGIEQKYSLDVDRHYIDVSKVKVEWTISEIEVGYQSYKTWNTDTLEWDEVKSSANVTSATAEFKLTNYSSVEVEGTVAFAPATDAKIAATFAGAVYTNNAKTIDTMVKSDRTIDAAKKTNAPSNTIYVGLEFNENKFLELEDASSVNYGLYTVTIREIQPD